MTRPTLFIGSSKEGLDFARAARGLLDPDAEITLWNEGFFRLSITYIETLVTSLSLFDFAILVLTPDDMIVSRNDEQLGPRDNVLFELGLFMGRLGRERTFMLASSQIKVPSDLAGVKKAEYTWPRADSSHVAAVGAGCDDIRKVIKQLGVVEARVAAQVKDLRAQQVSTQSEVRGLQVAMKGIVTEYEHDKLLGLATEGPFSVHYSHRMYEEIRRLCTIGYLKTCAGPIDDLRRLGARLDDQARRQEQFDLKEYVAITAEGQEYVRIRSQLDQETLRA